jgi:hypothetical protein
MPAKREIEINSPGRAEDETELREHLVSASNELYLVELLCAQRGREVPAGVRRAHAAVRAELKRLEAARTG